MDIQGRSVSEQLIGVRYCTSSAVNEARLHRAPGLYEASTIARTEPNVKTRLGAVSGPSGNGPTRFRVTQTGQAWILPPNVLRGT